MKTPLEHGWRHAVAAGLYHSGLLKAMGVVSRRCEVKTDNGRGQLQRVRRPKYIVLGYHNVGEQGLPLYCRLTKTAFRDQMVHIRRNYRVLSLRQMLAELQDPEAQGQGVVVTFDDGYLGTYSEAFPVLKECSIPATVYLTAGCIENGEVPWYDRLFLQLQRASSGMVLKVDETTHISMTAFASRVDAATSLVMYLRMLPDEERRAFCKRLDQIIPLPRKDLIGWMMSWQQIREMSKAGMAFGCHTMTHPVLSRLTADAVRREVAESKFMVENRLNLDVHDFAFPFGKPKDCGSIGANTLSDLGLGSAMTTIVGVNESGDDRFRLRRVVQGNEPSVAMFAYRLQRLFFHPIDEEGHATERQQD